jgi:hypothetical protein
MITFLKSKFKSLKFFEKNLRKIEIQNFFDTPNYFKEAFPFPCEDEKLLFLKTLICLN